MIRTFLQALFLSLGLGIFLTPAHAQPAGARGDNFVYIVQKDDTVALIAERFTSQAKHWRAIKAYNNISDVYAIPIGKQVLIPFKYIDTLPERAQVTSLVGEVYVDDQALTSEQSVQESQVIRTGPNSSVSLNLTNGNKVFIAPNSIVSIQRLRSFSGTGLIDAIFNAQVGSFTADVNAENTGVGRFEIRTPVSITGVRGTEVRNHVDSDGNTVVELLRGKTDISPASRPDRRQALAPNQGISISAKGRVGQALELPTAPAISTQVNQSKQELALQIHPVNEAQRYLVRYTTDEDGMREIARFNTQVLDNILPLPTANYRFYTQVRAINAQGMGGDDQTALIVLQSPSETDSSVDKLP